MILRISLSILYVFLAIILSQFIEGRNLKFMYWMIMILLFITCMNIYMTINYYIKLRNNPGIKGEKGEPGEQGEKGSNGVCVIDTKCVDIYDCRQLIEDKIEEKNKQFRDILSKQRQNILLNNKEKEIFENIMQYVDILERKCKDMTKEELINEIDQSLIKM